MPLRAIVAYADYDSTDFKYLCDSMEFDILDRCMAHHASEKTFAEFFAGIGLVREGLRSSGWQCSYANDIDPKKREMYEGHFGNSPHYHVGDVWKTEDVLAEISAQPRRSPALTCRWRGIGRALRANTLQPILDLLRFFGGLVQSGPRWSCWRTSTAF